MNKLFAILLFILPSVLVLGQIEETRKAGLPIPDFRKEVLVTSDTSIINATELKIYLVFNQSTRGKGMVQFKAALYRPAIICEDTNGVSIQFGKHHLLLKENGTEVKQVTQSHCNKKIESTIYRTNRVLTELENGEIEDSYVLDKTKHQCSLGTIEVERKQMQCEDTGINPFILFRKGKALKFTNIHNLQFFEYDVDADGSKEFYVLTYRSCSQQLRVYKIKD